MEASCARSEGHLHCIVAGEGSCRHPQGSSKGASGCRAWAFAGRGFGAGRYGS